MGTRLRGNGDRTFLLRLSSSSGKQVGAAERTCLLRVQALHVTWGAGVQMAIGPKPRRASLTCPEMAFERMPQSHLNLEPHYLLSKYPGFEVRIALKPLAI